MFDSLDFYIDSLREAVGKFNVLTNQRFTEEEIHTLSSTFVDCWSLLRDTDS